MVKRQITKREASIVLKCFDSCCRKKLGPQQLEMSMLCEDSTHHVLIVFTSPHMQLRSITTNDTLESVLEPLDGLLLVDAVIGANLGLAATSFGNAFTRACHAAVEVHSVDTNTRVVLDTEINVFADTEAKVASCGEVTLPQLVLLDLEATLENFLSLGATDSNMDGDLLVATDPEGADGVSCLAVDGGLTAQLLKHFGSTRQSITRLADRDVEDNFLDAELSHGVGALFFACFSHLD